jgi:hypothetical protein
MCQVNYLRGRDQGSGNAPSDKNGRQRLAANELLPWCTEASPSSSPRRWGLGAQLRNDGCKLAGFAKCDRDARKLRAATFSRLSIASKPPRAGGTDVFQRVQHSQERGNRLYLWIVGVRADLDLYPSKHAPSRYAGLKGRRFIEGHCRLEIANRIRDLDDDGVVAPFQLVVAGKLCAEL